MLKVSQLEKYYGNKNNVTKALNRVSFDVEDGEFIAIMGASGSGKTTLLNCISTIDSVSGGNVYLDNENISEMPEEKLARFRREKLGFVFQDFNLLDTLTIEENIAITLTINEYPPAQVREKVQNTARQLGIDDILSKFPYQISGGQKQRCACARAMVFGQSLILADEPTGALDSKSSKNLLELMGKINTENRATILMVTHDAFSASYAHRILFLKDGRLFNELYRGDKKRREFYHEILDVLSVLGGDTGDAL